MWLPIAVLIYHIVVLNPIEKIFVETHFGYSSRPKEVCKEKRTFVCSGMPSGHAEASVFIAWWLYMLGIKNPLVLFLVVVAVCAQRLYSENHTPAQVMAGLATGLLYTIVYAALGSPGYAAVFALVLSACLLLYSTIVINSNVMASLPQWFDKSLLPIIEKKRNVTLVQKMQDLLIYIGMRGSILFSSWNQFERDIQELSGLIKTNVDVVVGLKSGGAIMANYMGAVLKKPACYIKLARKCNRTVGQTYNHIIDELLNKRYDDLVLCEAFECDVRGKDVLLLDEMVVTGNTLKAAKKLIEEMGARSVSVAVFENRLFDPGFEYTSLKKGYAVYPWGFDN